MAKAKPHSLTDLLKSGHFPRVTHKKRDKGVLADLQLKMLRIQQGIWHQKRRAIFVFEGFDAAGKGGAIRRLVENLDPRGFKVHGIGPPTPEEQQRHYLYRFWRNLPNAGCLAIFDRSWYGRVLVERVENLTPKKRWQAAYQEILEFESMLTADGIDVVKIFLAIDKVEQLKRFEERLHDPYKQWKLTEADVAARAQWDEYVAAVDDMFRQTSTPELPWHLIAANDKHFARTQVLEVISTSLGHYSRWVEGRVEAKQVRSLENALRDLGLKKSSLR